MTAEGSHQPAAARNLNRPLSRFPLRGQAGGTAASAALRLAQKTVSFRQACMTSPGEN